MKIDERWREKKKKIWYENKIARWFVISDIFVMFTVFSTTRANAKEFLTPQNVILPPFFKKYKSFVYIWTAFYSLSEANKLRSKSMKRRIWADAVKRMEREKIWQTVVYRASTSVVPKKKKKRINIFQIFFFVSFF